MTESSDRHQEEDDGMQNNDGSDQRSDDIDAGSRLCRAIENIMQRDGNTEVTIERDPDVLCQSGGDARGDKSWKQKMAGFATSWVLRWLSTAILVGFALGVPAQVSFTWASLVYAMVYVVRWYVGRSAQKTVATAEVVVWIGNPSQKWLETQGQAVLEALGPEFAFRAGVPCDVDADPDVEKMGLVWTGRVPSKSGSSLERGAMKPHWRLIFNVFLKPTPWLLVAWAGLLLGSICLMQHWHRFSTPHAGVWKVLEAAVDDYYYRSPPPPSTVAM